MKNKKNIIIIGIVLLVISIMGLLIYKSEKLRVKKEKIEKEFDFPKTITINNTTKYVNYVVPMKIILYNIMEHDTIHIDVYYVTNNLISNEYVIQAHIIKHYFTPHSYILYLNKDINKTDILKIITHELIHLDQYEKGELQLFYDGQYYVFKGDTNSIMEVEYLKREYEIDAFYRTNEILNKYYNIIK